jgi:hypothetical protein
LRSGRGGKRKAWRPRRDEAVEAVGDEDQDEEKDGAAEDEAPVPEEARELGQEGKQIGAEDPTPEGGRAADHGEDQDVDSSGEAEVIRREEAREE